MCAFQETARQSRGALRVAGRGTCKLVLIAASFVCALVCMPVHAAAVRVPVLVYHRFATTRVDAMTVRLSTFDAQLAALKRAGYHVIPMRTLLAALDERRQSQPLPARSVVLCADDGHVSVFTQMYPRVRALGMPVTLFVYPSAISNAAYAMTWKQLAELKASGLFDVQSHTYWHPNFAHEKKHLTQAQFDAFVSAQLGGARRVLQQHDAGAVDMLAWPFGIHSDELLQAARQAGYVAAFSIERRPVTPDEQRLALPRFLITDDDVGARFLRLLGTAASKPKRTAAQ